MTVGYDALDLDWRDTPASLALWAAGHFEPVAYVERDGSGWRVRWPDGRRSEVMSIGAAKDYAASQVLAAVNQRSS
jgi:hypothetical protein